MEARSASRRNATVQLRVALALLLVALIGPLVQDVTAQSGSRFALSAALAEHGTASIDGYLKVTAPIDRLEIDGRHYSDKAPLQPLVGAVPYWVADRLGAESASAGRIQGNLTLWWLALWTGVVPAAGIVVLAHVVATRVNARFATAASLSLMVGTMLALFASNLFGHALAALLGFAAWALASDDRPLTPARLAAAGLLAGLAVAAEYPLAVVAAVVGVHLLVRVRARVAWYVVGALPAVALLLAYQWWAFGDPFSISYENKDLAGGSDTGLSIQPFRTWFDATVGSRGILTLTPIVAVGLAAAIAFARRRSPERIHGIAALAVFGGLLAMIVTRPSTWPNPIGGEVAITRHFYPLIPFLAAPLTLAWERWRRVPLAATLLGALFMLPPLLTVVYIPANAPDMDWYRVQLRDHGVIPTIFTLGPGGIGWVVHGALVAAAAWLVVQRSRAAAATPPVAPT